MKSKFYRSLICGILLCACAACQPSPEADIIRNKNDGVLDGGLSVTQEAAVPTFLPDGWSGQYQFGNTICRFKAKIEAPQTEGYAVLKVRRRPFDASSAVAVVNYFASTATGYRDIGPTEDELYARLVSAKRGLYQRNDQGKGEYVSYPGQKEEIKKLEEQIAQLNPPVISPVNGLAYSLPMQNTFVWDDGNEVEIHIADDRVIMLKDRACLIQEEDMIFDGNAAPGESKGTLLQNVRITSGQAEALSEQALKALAIADLGLAAATKARLINIDTLETIAEGWFLHYARADGGIPPFHFGGLSKSGVVQLDKNEFAAPWPPESISIFVDASGIRYFEWSDPVEVCETLNPNVSLLPFDEIQTSLLGLLKAGLAWRDELEQGSELILQFDFSGIVLTNSLIHIKDDLEYGMLVPTWMFVYRDSACEGTSIRYSAIAINAIDGSYMNPLNWRRLH